MALCIKILEVTMKLNSMIKKLFVIAALGGFCMPAQAMLSGAWDSTKKFVQRHPYISVGAAVIIVGGYVIYQNMQHTRSDLEKLQDAVHKLQQKGHMKYFKLFYEMEDVFCISFIQQLSDYTEFKDAAACYHMKNNFEDKSLRHDNMLGSMIIRLHNIEIAIAEAQDLTRYVEDKSEAILCECTRSIPFLIRRIVHDSKAMKAFEDKIEKFDCNEYRVELWSKLVKEKNKKVMCGMLAQKKLVDTQWRFT